MQVIFESRDAEGAQMRELSIGLFASYGARIRIVYLEAPERVIVLGNHGPGGVGSGPGARGVVVAEPQDVQAREVAVLLEFAELLEPDVDPPVVGNAQVRITVDELGRVVGREIVKSSGNPDVDQAALANVDYAIKDCKEEGLPQAPKGLTEAERSVLQGYSFR